MAAFAAVPPPGVSAASCFICNSAILLFIAFVGLAQVIQHSSTDGDPTEESTALLTVRLRRVLRAFAHSRRNTRAFVTMYQAGSAVRWDGGGPKQRAGTGVVAVSRGLQPRDARGRVRVDVQRQHLALDVLHTPQRLAARRKVRVVQRAPPVRRLEQRLAANYILANVVDDLPRPRRDAAVAFVAVVARGDCERFGARDLRQEVLLHLLAEEALRVFAGI